MRMTHKQKQGLMQESRNQHFNLLYNKYKLLALNMFTWENLPETIKPRYIEKSLLPKMTGSKLSTCSNNFCIVNLLF